MKWYHWLLIIIIILVIIAIVYRTVNPLRYFTWEEFDSPALPSEVLDPKIKTYKRKDTSGRERDYLTGSGKANMDRTMISRLSMARGIIEKGWNKENPNNKIVFKINSGYRTQQYNDTIKNSVKNSSHIGGLAVDIAYGKYSTTQKKEIGKALLLAGFRRFGPANSFIHADDDINKPQFANWGYPNPLFDVFRLVA